MSVADQLGAIALFAHFEADDLGSLAAATSAHRAAAGGRLDELADSAFLVERGSVELSRTTPYGPFVLRRVGDGALFGEATLLGFQAGADMLAAEAETSALVFDRDTVAALSEASQRFHLSLLWSLWKSLSGKLRRANDRLTEFFNPALDAPQGEPPSRPAPAAGFRVDIAAKRGLFQEQRLSGLEINFLTTLSREERYADGEAVFHEGEPAEAMYVVLDGKVRISKHIPGVGEEALSFLERGAYFGEMALIDSQARSASAVAHGGEAVVLAIPRDVLGGLLDIRKTSSPRLLRLLCEMLCRRLRELDDKLVGWHILSAGSPPHAAAD